MVKNRLNVRVLSLIYLVLASALMASQQEEGHSRKRDARDVIIEQQQKLLDRMDSTLDVVSSALKKVSEKSKQSNSRFIRAFGLGTGLIGSRTGIGITTAVVTTSVVGCMVLGSSNYFGWVKWGATWPLQWGYNHAKDLFNVRKSVDQLRSETSTQFGAVRRELGAGLEDTKQYTAMQVAGLTDMVERNHDKVTEQITNVQTQVTGLNDSMHEQFTQHRKTVADLAAEQKALKEQTQKNHENTQGTLTALKQVQTEVSTSVQALSEQVNRLNSIVFGFGRTMDGFRGDLRYLTDGQEDLKEQFEAFGNNQHGQMRLQAYQAALQEKTLCAVLNQGQGMATPGLTAPAPERTFGRSFMPGVLTQLYKHVGGRGRGTPLQITDGKRPGQQPAPAHS